MIQWSGKAGEYPNGDPDLHHVAGVLYAEGVGNPFNLLRCLCVY